MIEFKQLHKTYHVNRKPFHALQNINLHIKRGQIFGIVGESGAGKSTLLRLINLLDRPTQGEIYIEETPLTSLTASQLKLKRRMIGMIFQHFNLLQSRTAFENIALPLELISHSSKRDRALIAERVSILLDLVRLREHQHKYPNQLSGGQKQRVAIARALATEPKILLCDEPTSALDPHSTASILKLLREINQKLGVTIVIITHELDVIKQLCDSAAILDHGQLIEHGTVIDLFTKPESPITQKLVQQSLHITLPASVLKNLQAQPAANLSCVVRFTFIGSDSNLPFISTLARKYDLDINIILANIENIQEATVGFTICKLSGASESIQQALASVKLTSVNAEILGYA